MLLVSCKTAKLNKKSKSKLAAYLEVHGPVPIQKIVKTMFFF